MKIRRLICRSGIIACIPYHSCATLPSRAQMTRLRPDAVSAHAIQQIYDRARDAPNLAATTLL